MRDRETKRSRTDLYAQVLEVLIRYPEGGRITRVSYGVGVPVDRLRKILEALSSYGLTRKLTVEEQTLYFATPRGLEFLDIYWKMKGFLEIFGEESPGRLRK
jgi:predicted transcriptional regulator